MFVGIDDTDSPSRMCTTYLGFVLRDRLRKYGNADSFLLYRLKPTVKFKTRGNGAIAFRFVGNEEDAKKCILDAVEEMADMSCENTNPGVAFVSERDVDVIVNSEELLSFPMRAVRTTLPLDIVEHILPGSSIEVHGYGNGRGRIGALAASIACCVSTMYPPDTIPAQKVLPDHTYELIAYRYKEKWGTGRIVDTLSVVNAERLTNPATWDSVDLENKELVCTPSTGCPVLFGIRGYSPDAVLCAYKSIVAEPHLGYVIYRTNEGTDMHLHPPPAPDHLKDSESYIVRGVVAEPPTTIRGGHVFITVRRGASEGGDMLRCAAFEPTKQFRNIIRALLPGDEVEVYGSYVDGVLNLEKISVLRLVRQTLKNPTCPVCGKSMKSQGRGQGFRCIRCGEHKDERELVPVERAIEEGFYEVPPCARRHLAKPLVRTHMREWFQ